VSSKRKPKIIQVRPAGDNHQVITLKGGDGYMRKPCATCPWRVDATGEFPAEAFKHSAPTSYDMALNSFACHTSGKEKTKTCAGFLLRGADDNLSIRMRLSDGRIDMSKVSDDGHELHATYRTMAIANGVNPADPVLEQCQPEMYQRRRKKGK
jgi:hypothetical protein